MPKAEVIHRRGPWRSFEVVAYATLEWVDWFNNRRLLGSIGNIPPAEAQANFCAALDADPMAAYQTEISLRQKRRGSVCRSPFLCEQPLLLGARPTQSRQLQGQPHRRSRRLARSLHRLTPWLGKGNKVCLAFV
jgi:hypothetical protein